MKYEINRNELANIFEIDISYIHKLVKYGMPKLTRGKYDLVSCIQWYIKFWKEKAGGNNTDRNDQRIKLMEAQTEKIILETDKIRENLLQVEEVAHCLNAVATIVSTQLDGMGPRMANTLSVVDEPSEIQRLLFHECRNIRTTIADQIDILSCATEEN